MPSRSRSWAERSESRQGSSEVRVSGKLRHYISETEPRFLRARPLVLIVDSVASKSSGSR